ncbi:unnamed protein product [Ectocarpus fasciculatus]
MALGVTTSATTGQPCVALTHPNGGSVEVQLHGATVTSFKTSSGSDVLFLSEKAVFNGAKAIRGGIPLVFPQFGQPDKAMPSHGVARTASWSLSEEDGEPAVEGHVKANFLLGHSEETLAKWPHPFSLRYEVDLGADVLAVTLHITNSGEEAFDFQALLHTYLTLPEIEGAKVQGFQNVQYIDQLENNESFTDERPQADFTREVDRIYTGEIGNVGVVGGTTVTNSCEKTAPGAAEVCVPVDVVLWNPWIAKAKSLGDFGDEEYHKMVCIEPGIVSKFHSITPGETFSLKQVITPA